MTKLLIRATGEVKTSLSTLWKIRAGHAEVQARLFVATSYGDGSHGGGHH